MASLFDLTQNFPSEKNPISKITPTQNKQTKNIQGKLFNIATAWDSNISWGKYIKKEISYKEDVRMRWPLLQCQTSKEIVNIHF